MRAAALALVLAVTACGCEPPAWLHKPTPPHAQEAGACERKRDALVKLGGCGVDVEHYAQHCHEAEKAEAGRVQRTQATLDCMVAAKGCGEFFSCR